MKAGHTNAYAQAATTVTATQAFQTWVRATRYRAAGAVIAAEVEQVVDPAMGGEGEGEALGVFTMLKDPPRAEASDPTRLTIQPMELKIPTGIPTGAYDAN